MGINRGKDFENVIKKAFKRFSDVSIDRLHDQTTGYMGSSNICDFIVYKRPNQYYIECKSTGGKSLPLTRITKNQFEGLIAKSKIPGVIAGVIVWFIDLDKTYFIPITYIDMLKKAGIKSINPTNDYYDILGTDMWKFPIEGKKQRVFFRYDMTKFFKEMEKYYLL